MKDHYVDMEEFTQFNARSGTQRHVRRRIVLKSQPLETREFDGRKIYMNRLLNGNPNSDTEGLSFTQIVGEKSEIQTVLASSFGTDTDWLLSHFTHGTDITLIDHPSDVAPSPSSDWPQFRTVFPNMQSGGSGSYHPGTMHAKLICILYSTGILRIVISSANLIPFDWDEFTQVIWVQDILSSSSGSSNPPSEFGDDLHDFITRILSTSPESVWPDLIRQYRQRINEQVPGSVALVASVPGTFRRGDIEKFGHRRLRFLTRDIPSNMGVDSIASQPSSTLYQCSSIGQLQGPFMDDFLESIRTDTTKFKLVWPTYSDGMNKVGKDHMFLSEKNAKTAIKFMTALKRFPGRMHALNHSKCIVNPYWAYIGSANMSIPAWGRSVFDGEAFHIASYELGIFMKQPIYVPEGQQPQQSSQSERVIVSVPFIVPLDPPPPITDKPWMLELFQRTIVNGGGNESFNQFMSTTKDGKIISIIFPGPAKSDDVVHAFLHATLIPQLERETHMYMFQEIGTSPSTYSYYHHLAALFKVERLPAIIFLSPGSSLNKLVVLNVLDTPEKILAFDSGSLVGIIDNARNPQVPVDPEKSMMVASPATSISTGLRFLMENNIRLLCLDIDGTIVETNQSFEILPAVRKFFENLDTTKTQIALVTNQGAVGLRYWMETGKFGDPNTLPTKDEVEKRLGKIKLELEKISRLHAIPLFAAFRYQSKGKEGKTPRWGPVPPEYKDAIEWSQEWRKPNAGMIRAAMKFAKISPFDGKSVLMVGDMDSDEGAAKAAGVRFARAPDFFS